MKTKNYLVIICLVMVTFFMGVTNNPVEARIAPGITAEEFDQGGGDSSGNNSGDFESNSGTIQSGASDVGDCEGLLSADFVSVMKEAYGWIEFFALALTIVLGSLDFGRAVVSDDQDGLKKAAKKFKTRIIILIVILLTPVIVKPVLQAILGNQYDVCGLDSI